METLRAFTSKENWLGILEDAMKELGIRENSEGKVEFENEQLIPALGEALDDHDAFVRELALQLLGELGNAVEPVLPKMIEALRDPDRMVRAAAVTPVAGFGEKARQAVPILLEWIEQPDELIRVHALENIPRMDPSKSKEMLELLIAEAEQDGKGQVAAIMALGGLGELAAVPVLKQLLDDDTAVIRLLAAEAIHFITGDIMDSIRVATEMLDDPEWEVRYMAEEHLEQWQGRPRVEFAESKVEVLKIKRSR